MSFISNIMKDKYSFDFRRHSDKLLLLLFISVHCLESLEFNISAFCLTSLINSFSQKISGKI